MSPTTVRPIAAIHRATRRWRGRAPRPTSATARASGAGLVPAGCRGPAGASSGTTGASWVGASSGTTICPGSDPDRGLDPSTPGSSAAEPFRRGTDRSARRRFDLATAHPQCAHAQRRTGVDAGQQMVSPTSRNGDSSGAPPPRWLLPWVSCRLLPVVFLGLLIPGRMTP